jgi:CMP-N,N'-diacetyllegionaminic acid synthase
LIAMKTVAIIPARGGSKSIPRKNIKLLCGKPLIAYAIEAALAAEGIDRVIVSTEDPEIADVAKRFGAEVPFTRPAKLARDETPTLPVLQHAVKYLEDEEDYRPDAVVLLYATSPMLSSKRISEGVRLLTKGCFDSVVSVVEDRGHYWTWRTGKYVRLYPKVVKNRQQTKPLLKENGALYISRRDLLMKKGSIVGAKIGFLAMEPNESVDIDEPSDFEYVEELLAGRMGKN